MTRTGPLQGLAEGFELVLPPGTGEVQAQITRFSGDAMLLIPESGIEVLVPARRELDASWSLYARASLAVLS